MPAIDIAQFNSVLFYAALNYKGGNQQPETRR